MKLRFSFVGKSCRFKRAYKTLTEARIAAQRTMDSAPEVQLYAYNCVFGGTKHWHLSHKKQATSIVLGVRT